MRDKNLVSIQTIIKKLNHKKMICEWSDVLAIQSKIIYYKNKIDQGILFEPTF